MTAYFCPVPRKPKPMRLPNAPVDTLPGRIEWVAQWFGGWRPLARKVGVSHATLQNLASRMRERGAVEGGNQATYEKLIRATSVSRDWLHEGKGQPFDAMDDLLVALLDATVRWPAPVAMAALALHAQGIRGTPDDWRRTLTNIARLVEKHEAEHAPPKTTVRPRRA